MKFGLILFWFTLVIIPIHPVSMKKINPLLIEPSNVAKPRIVGGETSEPYEFPWIVDIRFSGKHTCGGTILNAKYFVTAAHCIKLPRHNREFMAIYTREHNLYCYEGVEEGRVVTSIRIHEKYDNVTNHYDLAIVGVDPPFVFSSYVKALDLPPTNFQYPEYSTVAGWGLIRWTPNPKKAKVPDRLRKLELQRYDDNKCNDTYRGRMDPVINVCYGGGSTGSCLGDSGGPVVCSTPNGGKILCAMVSFAFRCANPGTASVFVRIPYFADWIRENSKLTGIHGPTFRNCSGHFDGPYATFILSNLPAGANCQFIFEVPYQIKTFFMDQWFFLPEDEIYFTDQSQICSGCKPIKFNQQGQQKTYAFSGGSSVLIFTIRLSLVVPKVQRFMTFTYVSEGNPAKIYPLTDMYHTQSRITNISYPSEPKGYYYNSQNVLFLFNHYYKGRAEVTLNVTRMDIRGGSNCRLDRVSVYHLSDQGNYVEEARYCSQRFQQYLKFQAHGSIIVRFLSTPTSVFGRGFELDVKLTPV